MNELMVAQPRHPEWRGAASRFDEHYISLGEATYPIVGEQPGLEKHGAAEPRKCCFCGECAPVVTFGNEAHLIPASVGNRIHISLEECDLCNEKGGKERENNLARFLDPYRSLFLIPGRRGNGYPEFKLPGAQACIRRGLSGALEIRLFEGDDSIKIEHPDDHTLKVVVREQPICRRMRAMQSLLRSAWMLLAPAGRERYATILTHTKDQVPVLPFEFWQFVMFGRPWPWGRLAVWAKREGSSVPGAEVIVDFRVANVGLVWQAPNILSGTYEPTLFPPVEIAESCGPGVTTLRHRVSADDPEQVVKDASFSFDFERRSERLDAAPCQAVGLERPPPVSIELQIEDGSGIHHYGPIPLRVDRADKRGVKFRLGDESTPVFLAFRIGRRAGKLNEDIHFKPRPSRVTVEEWLETCRFFARLEDPLSKVTIIRDGQRAPFAPLQDVPALGTQFVAFRDDGLLQDLISIGRTFNTPIRFPESDVLDETTRMKIHLLGGGIRRGRVAASFPGARMLAPPSEADGLESALSRGSLILNSEMLLVISGLRFDSGPVRVVVPSARITARSQTTFPDGSPAVEMTVAAEGAVYEFERWLSPREAES